MAGLPHVQSVLPSLAGSGTRLEELKGRGVGCLLLNEGLWGSK